ncbi:MAG TPA: hypothetical protein VM260_10470 [Pirellula sp.]|nr:hypothetical protein [Pirellula sp.]
MFRKFKEERNITVILVTQDVSVALNARRNIFLRDGKIIAHTLEHEIASPALKNSQEFV